MTFKIEKIRTNGNGLDAAHQLVKDQPGDWRHIGSGVYGTVYGCKDKDWVYKVGDLSDNDGYLSYLTQLSNLKEHNPFTPKIYGVRFYVGKYFSGFVVAMERLKPIPQRGRGKVWALSDFIEGNGSSDLKRVNDLSELGVKVEFPKPLEEVIGLLRRAKKQSKWASWDLHMGNFMMRDRQLVITDPLA